MDDIIEFTDSQNGTDFDSLDAEALKKAVADERAKRVEIENKNRQLYERAKKAEGFEKQDDGSWVKTIERKPAKESTEHTDFDYSQKAFLLAKGIEEQDFSLVLDEAKKFGSDLKNVKLEDLITNPYFQQKLESTRTTRANEMAADTSGRGNNGASSKNSPEYWLAKLGPNDPVPSDLPRDLRERIVDARRANSSTSKMFYND